MTRDANAAGLRWSRRESRSWVPVAVALLSTLSPYAASGQPRMVPPAVDVPDAPASWQPITLRHRLSHTSGIPDWTSDMFDYRRDCAIFSPPGMATAVAARAASISPPVHYDRGPRGIRDVFSNGHAVLSSGVMMEERPGTFLTREGRP